MASLESVRAELMSLLYGGMEGTFVVNVLKGVELRTGVQREHLVLAAAGLLSLYLVFGSLAPLVCNVIGIAWPLYASLRGDQGDVRFWNGYWCIYAAVGLLDLAADTIYQYFPFYWLLKCVFLVALYLPPIRGADVLIKQVVEPAILKYELWMNGTKADQQPDAQNNVQKEKEVDQTHSSEAVE